MGTSSLAVRPQRVHHCATTSVSCVIARYDSCTLNMLLLITCWITLHHPNLFHKSTLLTEMKVENIFAHSWLPCVALMRLLRHKTDFELSDSLWCSVLAHVDLLPFTSPTSQPHQSQWQQGKKTEACTETAKKKNVQVRAIVVYFVKKKKKRQEKLSVTTLKKTNKNMQMLVQHCAGCTQQLHCFSSQERDRWWSSIRPCCFKPYTPSLSCCQLPSPSQ